MRLIKIAGDRADVQFSYEEIIALNNSLNAVCNGIKINNFETKIGTSREQARMLLDSVHKLMNELRPPWDNINILQKSTNKSSTYSITIKKKCVLETSGYQVAFFMKSLDYSKRAIVLGVMLTRNSDIGGVAVKSTVNKIMVLTLGSLLSYLERHIHYLNKNPNYTSDLFNFHIFKIQALSGNVTSEDEGSFTLRFMVNVGKQKDKENTSIYESAEAVVTFANIRSFTASLHAALNEFSSSN